MLTFADWIAVATIALPLVGKLLTDWQANAVANKNAALLRLVGMAGREAATIGRTLAAAPPGIDAKDLESSLIQSSVGSILAEMGATTVAAGGSPTKVTAIVQGELDKIVVAPVVLAKALPL